MNRDLKREHESFLQSLLRHCTVPQFGELDWSVLPTCSWFTIFTMYKKTMYVRNIDLPLSAKLPKCKQVSHTLNTWIHTYTYEHILYRYRYYTSNMDPETVHLLNREKIILEQHIDLHVKFARCTLHDRRARKNIWNIHMKPLINSCFCWWFLLKKQDVLFFFLGEVSFQFLLLQVAGMISRCFIDPSSMSPHVTTGPVESRGIPWGCTSCSWIPYFEICHPFSPLWWCHDWMLGRQTFPWSKSHCLGYRTWNFIGVVASVKSMSAHIFNLMCKCSCLMDTWACMIINLCVKHASFPRPFPKSFLGNPVAENGAVWDGSNIPGTHGN